MPLVRKPALSQGPAPSETPDPFVALSSASPEQRWAAARLIGGRPGGVEALGAALAEEADPQVREAIFMGLARAATRESVNAVLPYLRVDDARMRTGALDALRAMPGAVLPVLSDLLADPDSDVRLLSCEIARVLPPDQATPPLCQLLEHEADANVCAAAVEVLAEVGEVAALPVLARCVDRFPHETFLRFSIKAASEGIAAQAVSRD